MMAGNGTPVTWGRFDEYRRAIDGRLEILERRSEELSGQSAEHQAIRERLVRLEQFHNADAEANKTRRERVWVLALTIMSSFVLPVLVAAFITYIHIVRSH